MLNIKLRLKDGSDASLTQAQVDLLIPVLNDHLKGKISKSKINDKCLEVLEAAGLPATSQVDADKSSE